MQALQLATTVTAVANESQLIASVRQICDAASSVVILSAADMRDASDLVKVIKTRWKEIDEERTGIVKPINDSVKRINDRFREILAPLTDAEAAVKRQMLTFQQEENRKAEEARREAERKAAEAAEAAEAEAAASDRAPMPHVPAAPPVAAPLGPPQTIRGSYGSVSSVKKVWSYELVDIAALAAARPDLVTVDAAKVNAEIRGRGGDIPGLRIFQTETIAVR